MSLPAIQIVEVGPRDGLQNEPVVLSVGTRIALIEALADAGLRRIEIGSFVSARRIPQMASTDQVIAGLRPRPDVRYSALVPNVHGLEQALAAGMREIAVFAAASEEFSQRNINCSIAESLDRFQPVLAGAAEAGVLVRGYVSCALGCPYEGAVAPSAVAWLASRLHAIGCYEISLGDTIGCGTPASTTRLIEAVSRVVPIASLALHCHDTNGNALANVEAGLSAGVGVFDSAIGGLGGCPYAPGAPGNLATEVLIDRLQARGVRIDIDPHTLRLAIALAKHGNRYLT